MPRIKRWFPVSQEINRDAQLWELCRLYGDRALRIWLELLSIADRNDGSIPGASAELPPDLRRALADASRTTGRTVTEVWRTLREWSWVNPSTTPMIAKYWKYHVSRETKEIPRGKPAVSPPNLSEPSEPLKDKDKSASVEFEAFWKAYPRKVGKGAAKASWKKIAPANGTGERILQAISQQKGWKAWKEGFIPLPATWLNQTRWEDEGLEDVKPKGPFVTGGNGL